MRAGPSWKHDRFIQTEPADVGSSIVCLRLTRPRAGVKGSFNEIKRDVPRAGPQSEDKRYGEAYHNQNPPELHCGDRAFLRYEKERTYND